MKTTIFFLFCGLIAPVLWAQQPCIETAIPEGFPFLHGVASGDAEQERVIIWSRVSTDRANEAARVNWKMALDSGMTQVVQEGQFFTDGERDFTVKVDVDNLSPNSWYYYQFEALGLFSPVGRTHTLPESGTAPFRMAVMSCANYQKGYFNVYKEVGMRNDLQAVVFLGDYYYSFPANWVSAFLPNRDHVPDRKLVSLSDYRTRHAQMKSDQDLQLAHQQYPWYLIWDDHEFENDAWKDGAGAHVVGIYGPWEDRKQAAYKAYFEWMPVREDNVPSIKRSFEIGDLAKLYMLDTRIEGRDQQVALNDPSLNDPGRTILGDAQKDWLVQEMDESNAIWNIFANQIIFSPTLNSSGRPLQNDIWDGYPTDRDWMLNQVSATSLDNFIVLTGGFHASWGMDIPLANYDRETMQGSAGCEFLTCGVTSDPHQVGDPNAFFDLNPHVQYLDQVFKGFMLVDIEPDSLHVEWHHIQDVTNPAELSHLGAVTSVLRGQPYVQTDVSVIDKLGDDNLAPLASTSNRNPIFSMATDFELGTVFPAPAGPEIFLSYAAKCDQFVDVSIYDIKGRIVQSITNRPVFQGRRELQINTSSLDPGTYLLDLKAGKRSFGKKFIIQ